MDARPSRFLLRSALHIVIYVAFVLVLASCWKKSKERDLPKPQCARRPVRMGVLPQLKAALDYLWRVEMTQSEEVDNLPVLTHALATFYGWPDPKESPEPMVGFLRRFCTKRTGKPSDCATLNLAMGTSRRVLLDDLVHVTRAYLKMGFRDAGSRSLKSLLTGFQSHRARLQSRLAALRARWPGKALPVARFCRLNPLKAMVVEANLRGVWVNGMAVLGLERGRLPKKTEALEGLQTLLVAGAAFGASRSDKGSEKRTRTGAKGAESPPNRGPTHPPRSRPFILRVSVDLPTETIKGLLRLAAEVGLTRVHLRVRRVGGMEIPCLLPLDVIRSPVRPERPMATLKGQTVYFVDRHSSAHARQYRLDRKAGTEGLKKEFGRHGSVVTAFQNTNLQNLIRVWEMIAVIRKPKAATVWLGYKSASTSSRSSLVKDSASRRRASR